jgi:hypothetical protein
VVTAVVVGGVLGVLPDRLFCAGCGRDPVPTTALPGELVDALVEATEASLPARVADDLTNGFVHYTRAT